MYKVMVVKCDNIMIGKLQLIMRMCKGYKKMERK